MRYAVAYRMSANGIANCPNSDAILPGSLEFTLDEIEADGVFALSNRSDATIGPEMSFDMREFQRKLS